MLGVAEGADEDVLGGQVDVQDHGDHQAGKGEAVGNLLHEDTGGSEGRRCDEGTAEVVDDDADDEVGSNSNATAKSERVGVVLGVPHLGSDREVCRYTSEGEDDRADGRHGFSEGRASNEHPVGSEVSGLGSSSGALLKTGSDGDGEDGRKNREHADPREPGDLAESANAGNAEADDSSDCDEDGSAGPVGGNSVETNGNTKHSRTSNEDPEEAESDSEDVPANLAKEQHAHVGNAVDLRVVQLELTDDVGRPCCDDSDDQKDDDPRNHAESVECLRQRKHTETDLSLHHEDRGSEPANAAVVGSSFFVDVAEDCICDLAICAGGYTDELLVEVLLGGVVHSHCERMEGGSGGEGEGSECCCV